MSTESLDAISTKTPTPHGLAPQAGMEGVNSFSSDRYRMLIESIRDYSVLGLNVDGEITLWDPGAQRILGYEAEEVLGKHISIFYKPEDTNAGHPQEELRIALAQGQYEEQGWRVRKDGSLFWAEVVITPTHGPDGEVVGFTKVTRDITRRNEEETKYRRIFETACEAFLVVNGSGQITLANSRSEELFGYSRSELIGMRVEQLMPERFRSGHPALRSSLMRGDTFPLKDKQTRRMMGPDLELFGLRKDGTEFPVEISLSGLDSSDGNLVTCSISDITDRVAHQEAVKASEEQFRSIFETTPVSMSLRSREGFFIRVNTATVNFLGYSADELQSMTYMDVTHPDDLAETHQSFQDILSGTLNDFRIEKRYIHKNGNVIWGLLCASAIKDDHGEIRFIAVQIVDITARKRAEEDVIRSAADLSAAYDNIAASEEQFRNIFENTPIGMALLTPNGSVVRVNRAIVEFYGRDENELLSMSIDDTDRCVHADDVNSVLEIFSNVISGEAENCQIECRFIHKNGEILWGVLGVSAIKDKPGNVCFLVVQIMDITARKEADDLIRAQASDLSRSNQDLLQFANIASHDLQEPLRTVTSFVQLINKRYTESLDDDGKQWMGYIVEATGRMQNLINDLLAYSRVGTRSKELVQVDFSKVVKSVLADLSSAIEQCDALVSMGEMPILLADEVQMTQLFQNLIGNGIKYRGERRPEISVDSKCSDGVWTFSVKDNGIGIEAQYFERIFMIFQRLHTRSVYKGTGMGLALCKRIVEQNGGSIWIESEPGIGSTFYFTMQGPPKD